MDFNSIFKCKKTQKIPQMFIFAILFEVKYVKKLYLPPKNIFYHKKIMFKKHRNFKNLM